METSKEDEYFLKALYSVPDDEKNVNVSQLRTIACTLPLTTHCWINLSTYKKQ